MENVMTQTESRKILIHEWLQVLAMGITVFSLFLWNHSEMHSNQKETNAIVNAIREDARDFREKWVQETKDFHGRLCAIEERNKK